MSGEFAAHTVYVEQVGFVPHKESLVSHLCGLNDLFLQVSEFERGTSMTHTTRWPRHCTACMLLNPNGINAVNTQKTFISLPLKSIVHSIYLPLSIKINYARMSLTSLVSA